MNMTIYDNVHLVFSSMLCIVEYYRIIYIDIYIIYIYLLQLCSYDYYLEMNTAVYM